MASGGYWNRAGRRSGGNRPNDITPVLSPKCLGCGMVTPFGLMPESIIRDTSVKSCPGCKGILFIRLRDGAWTTPNELKKALDAADAETETAGQRSSDGGGE